ncbi:hypothetical protein LCGC14_0459090 [marine sediment metagenome]|uniref:Uncharacterized protein n=1 Tax=marine sediment metagenome TaxID=412755 RepID=A0A0F9SFI2_9ZZZZ
MSAKPKQSQPNMANLFSGLMKQAQKGQSDEWWQTYHYPETVNFYPEQLIGCARSALYAKAMEKGVVFEMEKYEHGFLEKDNLDELVKCFDGRLIFQYQGSVFDALFCVFNDGAIYVHSTNSSAAGQVVQFRIVTLDEKKIGLFNSHYKSCVKNE